MTNPETFNKKPRCSHITKTGQHCHADPQTGREWCFFHDPEKKQKQAEAQKQGGEARTRQTSPEVTLPPNLPDLPLNRAYDIRRLMGETIEHLRGRKMDLRSARTIGYLAAIHLRALKLNYRLIAKLMDETINQFRRGEIDLPTAKTFGMLSSVTLCAVKQEYDELEAAAMTRTQAAVPTESIRPTQATSAEAPRPNKMETVVTAMVAAKSQDNQKLHPAVMNGSAVTAPNGGGIQIR